MVAAFMAMDALNICKFKKRPIQLLLQTDEESSSIQSNKATIDLKNANECGKKCEHLHITKSRHYLSATIVISKYVLAKQLLLQNNRIH